MGREIAPCFETTDHAEKLHINEVRHVILGDGAQPIHQRPRWWCFQKKVNERGGVYNNQAADVSSRSSRSAATASPAGTPQPRSPAHSKMSARGGRLVRRHGISLHPICLHDKDFGCVRHGQGRIPLHRAVSSVGRGRAGSQGRSGRAVETFDRRADSHRRAFARSRSTRARRAACVSGGAILVVRSIRSVAR
jgi:hypothetical protein